MSAGGARIGIDLGGTKIAGVVLERDGTVSASRRGATPRSDYRGTLAAVVEMVHALDGSGALPVGIGAPGAWIESRRRMQNCNSTWLNDRPLLSDLVAALGDRVRLANDADCFALSEALGGSGADAALVLGVILGTGVGGGLVAHGRLLSGPNGLTGEWGHTPLPYAADGLAERRCYCGRSDCIETFLSGPGLLATHRELWPREDATDAPADAEAVYRAAALATAPAGWAEAGAAPGEGGVRPALEAGPTAAAARARATLSVYCRMLARSLAQMVNVIDPHVIVLGGGLSGMQEIYAPVRELMARYVFGEVFETRLLSPRWGAASGVRGAAWLWE